MYKRALPARFFDPVTEGYEWQVACAIFRATVGKRQNLSYPERAPESFAKVTDQDFEKYAQIKDLRAGTTNAWKSYCEC